MSSFLLADREGSVVFLQEEHAKTLRALHEEIRILQQKCSRLTFELTVSGTRCSGNADCNTLFLEKELAEARSELVSLRAQLSVQEEGIELMKERMRQLTKELSSARQSKKDIIRICNYELEQKANVIAQLTAQLHRLRRRDEAPMETISPHSLPVGPHSLAFLPAMEHQSSGRASPRDGRVPSSSRCGRRLVKWPSSTDSPADASPLSTPTPATPIVSPPPTHPTPLPSCTPGIRRASGVQRRRLARSLEHPPSTSSFVSIASTDHSNANRQPVLSRQTTPPPKLPEAVATVKPVLPPIGYETTPCGKYVYSNDDVPGDIPTLHSKMAPTVTSPPIPPLVPAVVGATGRHRRFVLAKSQGLSSAPCAPLRLLHYSHPQPVGGIVTQQESEGAEKTEGTLLVKQKVTRRGDSSNSVLQH